MATTTITHLKATLSEQLDRVKAGEELVVTERGRPVARILPVAPGRYPDDRSSELVRQGLARAPESALDPCFLSPQPVADPRRALLEALEDERGER